MRLKVRQERGELVQFGVRREVGLIGGQVAMSGRGVGHCRHGSDVSPKRAMEHWGAAVALSGGRNRTSCRRRPDQQKPGQADDRAPSLLAPRGKLLPVDNRADDASAGVQGHLASRSSLVDRFRLGDSEGVLPNAPRADGWACLHSAGVDSTSREAAARRSVTESELLLFEVAISHCDGPLQLLHGPQARRRHPGDHSAPVVDRRHRGRSKLRA